MLIIEAYASRAASGFERMLLRWRYETMVATLRFLDSAGLTAVT